MAHEVETMFYRMETERDIPWHGLGQPVDDYLTAEQAIKAAGLDWEVDLSPTYIEVPGKLGIPKMHEVPDSFAVVRQTDHKVLGTVGARYEPIQNRELFSFLDNLVDSGDAKYETAGSLRGGSVVFMLARLDRDMVIDGDEVVPYIVATTSHDGSMALSVRTTPTRVVCMNTLRLSEMNARSEWNARHTVSATKKVQEAREALRVSHRYYDAFETEVEKLMDQSVTDAKFERIVEDLVPITVEDEESNAKLTHRKERRNELRSSYYDNPEIGKYKGSGWGVLNGVNGWELWQRPIRSVSRNERQALDALSDNSMPYTGQTHQKLVTLRGGE